MNLHFLLQELRNFFAWLADPAMEETSHLVPIRHQQEARQEQRDRRP